MPYSDKDKKKRKVQRLMDVEVTHVSLVDRPANRTPFKAIKRDEAKPEGATPMNITLKNMFGKRQPEITSVMADTQDKAVAVAKMVMTGDDAKVTEQDGVFIARKSGTEANDSERVVHMGKALGVAYTVAHAEQALTKALQLYDEESMDFGDTVQKEGFVPGLYTATEALHTTIRNIAMDDETKSPADFNSKVSKALDAFNTYVSDLITALPEQAFKFEKAVLGVMSPNVLQPIKPEGDGFNTEVYDAIFGETEEPEAAEASTEGDKASEAEATPAEPAEGAGEATQVAGEAKEGEQADATGEAQEATPAPANFEELPKGTSETQPATQEEILAGVMEGLTKTVGESITAALAPLNDRMDKQDAAIQKMSKAVGSAVVSTPDEDDDNVVSLSKSGTPKSYGSEGPPLMDTAYRSSKQG